MITVEDLLWIPGRVPGIPAPEMDPLVEHDALQEAQLLDLRIHALSSTAGLLFELRTALQFQHGNAALLVVHGLLNSRWRAVGRSGGRTAWTVVGSAMRTGSGLLEMDVALSPVPPLRFVEPVQTSMCLTCQGSARFRLITAPVQRAISEVGCRGGVHRSRSSKLPVWWRERFAAPGDHVDNT